MDQQLGPPSGRFSPDTEVQLDYWVELKRARDFDTADRIREELRARGIEPATERPPGYVKSGSGSGSGSMMSAGCRDFFNGTCNRGSSCKFSHTSQDPMRGGGSHLILGGMCGLSLE